MSSNSSHRTELPEGTIHSYAVCCHLPPNTWRPLLTCFQRQTARALFLFFPFLTGTPRCKWQGRWSEHSSQAYTFNYSRPGAIKHNRLLRPSQRSKQLVSKYLQEIHTREANFANYYASLRITHGSIK